MPRHETGFTMDTSSIKFGAGMTRELGYDVSRFGCRRVMVVTDERLASLPPVKTAMASLADASVDAVLFDRVRTEPTDGSFQEAIQFASAGKFDGYVAVGGGSVMDTAKAANLYATYPADLLAYVNAPIGRAEPVPGPLKPLIAVPTTAGTGSETTGVAIFDFVAMGAKTGIAHRALRPVVGIVDPENTRTLPPTVAACSGLDVLCHGLESYTALPFHQREAPASPAAADDLPGVESHQRRVGASRRRDDRAEHPRRHSRRRRRRAIRDAAGGDVRRRRVRQRRRAPLPWHVVSGLRSGQDLPRRRVSAGAGSRAARHVRDSDRPGRVPMDRVDRSAAAPRDGGRDGRRHRRRAGMRRPASAWPRQSLTSCARRACRTVSRAIGYTEADVDRLVEGTAPQHRVTKLSPRPVTPEALRELFRDSMVLW